MAPRWADFATLFTNGVYRKLLETAGYGKQVGAIEGSVSGVAGINREGGGIASAEGSGFAQIAFEQHLQRAAESLDKLRAERTEAELAQRRS